MNLHEAGVLRFILQFRFLLLAALVVQAPVPAAQCATAYQEKNRAAMVTQQEECPAEHTKDDFQLFTNQRIMTSYLHSTHSLIGSCLPTYLGVAQPK